MRVVFMGTPEFAVPSLEALCAVVDIVAVYSRPDAVSGRGRATRPSPVKEFATTCGLDVFTPTTLRDPSTQQQIRDLDADLLVVAAYGLILPQAVLDAARLGAINVHASLLPRWRGAAPIQRAILEGDEVAGVSIMRMEAGLDTGPYCLQQSVVVGEATAPELTDRLGRLGAEALMTALPDIISGNARWTPQDEALVTYAEKIAKRDVALSPDLTFLEAVRRVRASTPAAPSRAVIADRGVTVTAAAAAVDDASTIPEPGHVRLTKQGVVLGMSDGSMIVTRLKPDGKAEMGAADWARGVRDLDAACWMAAV